MVLGCSCWHRWLFLRLCLCWEETMVNLNCTDQLLVVVWVYRNILLVHLIKRMFWKPLKQSIWTSCRESWERTLSSSAGLVGFQIVLENNYLGWKYASPRKNNPTARSFIAFVCSWEACGTQSSDLIDPTVMVGGLEVWFRSAPCAACALTDAAVWHGGVTLKRKTTQRFF